MRTLSKNRGKGNFAETYAAAFLRRKGYTLLDRNYSYRGGELDIIAKSPKGEIVFTEVKSVWNNQKGRPESRVRSAKQVKLWRTACHFLHFNGGFEQSCRFDVIAVDCSNNKFSIRHIPAAFEANQTIPQC